MASLLRRGVGVVAATAPAAAAATPLAPLLPVLKVVKRISGAGGSDSVYDNFFTRHPVVTFLLGGALLLWIVKYFFHVSGHKSASSQVAAVTTLAKLASLNPIVRNNWGFGPGGTATYYGDGAASAFSDGDPSAVAAGGMGVANMGLFTPLPLTAIFGILQSTGALDGLAKGLKKLLSPDRRAPSWSPDGNVATGSVEGLVLEAVGIPSCNGKALWPPSHVDAKGQPSCSEGESNPPKFRCDYTDKCTEVSS
jgi:hypothetical protein